MTRRPNLAVVGATGAVGEVLLGLLPLRQDIWGEVRLVASPRSAGRKPVVHGELVEVLPLTEEVFDGIDVALFDVPDEVSARWAPVAAAKGVVVVDNSAAFRMDDAVPLVVPEVNAAAARMRPRGIIAGPNCTTLTMIAALGALHAEYGLSELVVASYQAASGEGRAGVDALREQVALVAGTEVGEQTGDLRAVIADHGPFAAPLALNAVPWSGALMDGGWASDELKLRDESRKILGLAGLKVSATCVRIPVVRTHALAVHAVFEREVTQEHAQEILRDAPGVVLYDDPASGEFPTPNDVVGTDPVWVGRVRRALDDPAALDLFLCGDNLRKGAALNALQIAELVAGELSG
ncbi:aspartate-semialdehyde dehydrogenase [Streptomyces sp. CB01881]|uniref:aspartate-semialdehyde dehydrogenase n=1 Tax=Streptomyces sp. CB01881 TaxID=2078691 RepID=UPI000CDCB0EA|nr:aspartate-semialdehyde dehydrogenase [Streptomyces sp. CB01881]AUY50966.1 aspartate-semialdehyde dehydrogenase [Streptomyces sp. CB01881]TYC74351.1 aspartate-semialdehyde dehydrogenase [Streptomyces sp. CB01881]